MCGQGEKRPSDDEMTGRVSKRQKKMPDYLVVLGDVKYGSEVILHCSGGQVAEATQTDKVNGVVDSGAGLVAGSIEVIPAYRSSVI